MAAVAVAGLLLCALLAASGFMLWQGHQASERRAQEAEFAAAARQGVVNLMSLDFNNGDADIKRLIDSTTGQFRDDFEKSKNDFLTVMKDSKVVTKADVKATAVENMTKDSADVMVAASSQISNSASAQQPAARVAPQRHRPTGQRPTEDVESRVRTVTADQKSNEARDDELTEADTAEELTEADTAEELTDAIADPSADVEGDRAPTSGPSGRDLDHTRLPRAVASGPASGSACSRCCWSRPAA